MAEIQGALAAGGYGNHAIFNADETGFCWDVNPTTQYVPAGASRATAPDSNEKSRITVMIGANGEGDVLPTGTIIFCSTAAADQSKVHVLNTLLASKIFNPENTWKVKWWQRSMIVAVGNKQQLVHFKRPYLCHPDGRIIWAQQRAWMDSCGLAMWCDLIVGPARKSSADARWALVWDNCKTHLVGSVLAVFAEWDIDVFQLPPYMTAILQPMDVVVNGPIKAHARRARISVIFDYHQGWAVAADAAVAANNRLPKYEPPKPTLADGIRLVSSIIAGFNESESFKAGLQRCFVNVGLTPEKKSGAYLIYVSHDSIRTRTRALQKIDATFSLQKPISEVNVDFSLASMLEDVHVEPAADDEVTDDTEVESTEFAIFAI